MKFFSLTVAIPLVALLIAVHCIVWASDTPQIAKIMPPRPGNLYHGVFPGGPADADCREPSGIQAEEVCTYEKAAGQKVAWIAFDNEWSESRRFPAETALWIWDRGAIPYIRLQLRSEPKHRENYKKAEKYSLQAIICGAFDKDLRLWARDARAFAHPLLLVFGAECNGFWSNTNGHWNGGGETCEFGDPQEPDGPERFRAAYRHIVSVMRSERADNITLLFHVNYNDNAVIGCNTQNPWWNTFEQYYPGDDVVDWTGISVYGTLNPETDEAVSFDQRISPVYKRLTHRAPSKPVIVAEFGYGVLAPKSQGGKAGEWARHALQEIFKGRWPGIIGFSWWNEEWCTDGNRRVTLRLQQVSELTQAFQETLCSNAQRLSPPVVTPSW